MSGLDRARQILASAKTWHDVNYAISIAAGRAKPIMARAIFRHPDRAKATALLSVALEPDGWRWRDAAKKGGRP